MLVMGRHGEQQGRHARFDVQLQAGNDDRHAQRVRPDALAAAEHGVAIHLPGVGDNLLQRCRLVSIKAFGEDREELVEIALRSDGLGPD